MSTPEHPTITISFPPELAEYIDQRIAIAIEQAISGDVKKARYLTRKEVCQAFNISLPTLSRYCKRGILKGKKIGSRILFEESSLQTSLKDLSHV